MYEYSDNTYLGLNNKFYNDDTKKSFERRTRAQDWEQDMSIFASSNFARYKNDPKHPILLALLEENRRFRRAKQFKRTTPSETFADNHFNPLDRPF